MNRFPKAKVKRHVKGQVDHVDAWLMSYADLITLLFMMFVIFVSISISHKDHTVSVSRGEPEHPYLKHLSGTLELGTPYDETYRTLVGLVVTNEADQHIAVEKSAHGVQVDMSSLYFFEPGT